VKNAGNSSAPYAATVTPCIAVSSSQVNCKKMGHVAEDAEISAPWPSSRLCLLMAAVVSAESTLAGALQLQCLAKNAGNTISAICCHCRTLCITIPVSQLASSQCYCLHTVRKAWKTAFLPRTTSKFCLNIAAAVSAEASLNASLTAAAYLKTCCGNV